MLPRWLCWPVDSQCLTRCILLYLVLYLVLYPRGLRKYMTCVSVVKKTTTDKNLFPLRACPSRIFYFFLSRVDKAPNEAREKALKDINEKKEVLDRQVDDEISKAEEEIKALRSSAPEKIGRIAIETSSELLQKLIGADVNNSSISAIVDDLSKRNGDKYYGN